MWTHTPCWRMPSLQMSRKSRWWQVMQPLSSEHRTQPVQFSSRPALAAGASDGEGLRHACAARPRLWGGSRPRGSPSPTRGVTALSPSPCGRLPTSLCSPNPPPFPRLAAQGGAEPLLPAALGSGIAASLAPRLRAPPTPSSALGGQPEPCPYAGRVSVWWEASEPQRDNGSLSGWEYALTCINELLPVQGQGTKSILEPLERSQDKDLSGCSRASAASLAASAVLPTWLRAASPEVGSAPGDKDGVPAPRQPAAPRGAHADPATAAPPRTGSQCPEKRGPGRCSRHGGIWGAEP